MSDYKMVPVVATGEMRIAGSDADKRLSVFKAADVYNAMLAAAPPFVVTDEVAERICDTFSIARLAGKSRADAMRAAIEAVLGGVE